MSDEGEGVKTTVVRGLLSRLDTNPILVLLLIMIGGAFYSGWRILAHLDRSDEYAMKISVLLDHFQTENTLGRKLAADGIVSEVCKCCTERR